MSEVSKANEIEKFIQNYTIKNAPNLEIKYKINQKKQGQNLALFFC